jgi:acetylornithine deacetylase/succinyl-diaminopimelate desuccinylase-like protein
MRTSIAAAVLVSVAALGLARADDVDLAAEEKSALELLRDMVRTDTSHDGGETVLLEKVKALLEADGIPSTIIEEEKGRGNLIARLKGDGRGKPFLFMAHVDTVRFDASEGWSADPLGAEIKGGVLHGRGTLDDKGQAALAVTCLRMLKKLTTPLARDVVVMLNCDEESGGDHGAKFIMSKPRVELGPVGAAVNEGGRCLVKDGKVVLVGIQTAEKVYNDVVVRVKGVSGHSSVPRPGNAIARLGRVIDRLEAWRSPLRITEAALGTFRGLAKSEKDASLREAMHALEAKDESDRERAAEVLAAADPKFAALLRSTFAFTLLRGGVRVNQLPPTAEVNLNVRLLPEETLEQFLIALRHVVRDEPDLEVEVVKAEEHSPPSSTAHPLYKAIEAAARRAFPDAEVVPILSTGATDSRFLRNKDVPTFGIGTFPIDDEVSKSVHGPDERVPVESFSKGLRYTWDFVRAYATTPD